MNHQKMLNNCRVKRDSHYSARSSPFQWLLYFALFHPLLNSSSTPRRRQLFLLGVIISCQCKFTFQLERSIVLRTRWTECFHLFLHLFDVGSVAISFTRVSLSALNLPPVPPVSCCSLGEWIELHSMSYDPHLVSSGIRPLCTDCTAPQSSRRNQRELNLHKILLAILQLSERKNWLERGSQIKCMLYLSQLL